MSSFRSLLDNFAAHKPASAVSDNPNLAKPATATTYPDNPNLTQPGTTPGYLDNQSLMRPGTTPGYLDKQSLMRPGTTPGYLDSQSLKRPGTTPGFPDNQSPMRPGSYPFPDNRNPMRPGATPFPVHQTPMARPGMGSRNLFSMSDSSSLLKQIEETHSPDVRHIDVKPIFSLVEDILKRTIAPDEQTMMESARLPLDVEDKLQQVDFRSMLEHQAYTIDKISSEIAHKALSKLDAHTTTVQVFRVVSNYSWDAKAVLTMAAFALDYGEFWLLAQIYSSNPLAKSMAILKQVPVLLQETQRVKTHYQSLRELIRWLLIVTKCILDYHDLPTNYIGVNDMPAFAKGIKHIPAACYWIIRGVVACITQIIILTTAGHDFELSTTETLELPTLTHHLKQTHKLLKDELDICHHVIEQKNFEAFLERLRYWFTNGHFDNMQSLSALISTKYDPLPLVDGITKKKLSLDVLRRKHVLLLITDLYNVNPDELAILEQINSEAKLQASRLEATYETVWIPIADTENWNEDMQNKFETLQAPMPWYTVHHPQVTEKAVRKYIQEDWKFNGRDTILVLLDPYGKKVTDNAIHMMWIWQSNAFPFSIARERQLWEGESWKFELLIDNIDQLILNWVRDDKYICLYGGDSIDWVKKFVPAAREVASLSRVELETAYVGKTSHTSRVQQVVNSIAEEKLGYYWDQTTIWFFWKRIESMLYSKIRLGHLGGTDPISKEIKRLLCYDKYSGWFLLAKGPKVLIIGDDYTGLTTLIEYERWREQVTLKGFGVAFVEHAQNVQGLQTTCTYYDFPHDAATIPEEFTCPECQRPMEKYHTVKCCHEKNYMTTYY